MESTTYRAGETNRVLSASTAARTRTEWTGKVTLGPVMKPTTWDTCARMAVVMTQHRTTGVTTHDGSFQDRGLAINPFPTRSGPPCSP